MIYYKSVDAFLHASHRAPVRGDERKAQTMKAVILWGGATLPRSTRAANVSCAASTLARSGKQSGNIDRNTQGSIQVIAAAPSKN